MTKPYGIIYLITNKVNGKKYVGQTIRTLEVRWEGHVKSAKWTRGNVALHRAIRKYGSDSFTVIMLEECSSQDELNAAERMWIERHITLSPKGYNLTTGGDGGYKFTPEVVARIAAKAKEQFSSPEARAKMAATKKKLYEDYPEKRAEVAQRTRDQFLDPVRRQKQVDSLKKFNESAEVRAERSRVLKQFNKTSGAREANAERLRRFNAEHPEARLANSESKKRRLAEHPEEKVRLVAQGKLAVKARWASHRSDPEYLAKVAKVHEALRTRGQETITSIAKAIGLSRNIVYQIHYGKHWSCYEPIGVPQEPNTAKSFGFTWWVAA